MKFFKSERGKKIFKRFCDFIPVGICDALAAAAWSVSAAAVC